MRYLALACVPLLAALAVLVVAVLFPEHRFTMVEPMIRVAKVMALYGCLVAALSFRRDEYLFRGWAYLAACYGLIILRDGILHRSLFIDIDTPVARWIELPVMLVANSAGVLSAWTMARAWQAGGIELPGTAATRGLVRAVTVVMAISITIPSLAVHAPHLLDGSPFPIMAVADAIADTLSMSLVAPVLLTAVGLRGSRVAWPWALLSASMFGWLCYDALYSLSSVVSMSGAPLWAMGEAFRMLALVSSGAAGMAQRFVLTEGVTASRSTSG